MPNNGTLLFVEFKKGIEMIRSNECGSSQEEISLWDISAPEANQYAPLDGDIETEVAIIGAGFSGLSAALHLAEKGVSCCVFDANKVGYGGSGRNCGMVNPGIWLPPQDVRKILGEKTATQFLDAMGEAPNYVFSLIEKFQIECEATRNGTIHAAHSKAGYKELAGRAEEWLRRGRSVELLNADAAKDMIGTSQFHGGLLDRQAGTVNPMGYARGLAKAAVEAGAKVYEQTRVIKLSQQDKKWRVSTKQGTVTADRILVCTNAYSDDLWPGLKQTLTHIHFYQVATEPLGALADKILPGGQSVWDTGLVMFSIRKDKFGRLIVGSMGKLSGKNESYSEYWAQKQLTKMFPEIGKVKFEKSWHGVIGLTPDHLPRIHNPAIGLYALVGFNGRGITTGTVFGKAMADFFTGMPEGDLLLPITQIKHDKGAGIREPVYEGCFKAWRFYKSI